MHKLIAALFLSHLAGPLPDVPLREPQLAAAPGLTAIAYGSGTSIYVATSRDGGRNFGKPVRLAEAPLVMLTHHRGPRIVISGNTIVVTAVMAHNQMDGDLLAWHSLDSGSTWMGPVRVNDVPAAAQEGLHTLAVDAHGNLFAAWLDHRGDKPGKTLYGAWSYEAGATWSKNVEIYESPDGSICPCCHPTALFDETGGLEVMWRNALAGSRDFYLIRADSARHFGKAEKLGTGTWKLNACPMDGGAMVRAGGKTITAWRRENEIFLSEPGKPETTIGEGKDVTMTVSGGKVYAAWIKGGQLILSISGKQQTIAEEAAFPNLVALPGGGALLAWEEKGGISLYNGL